MLIDVLNFEVSKADFRQTHVHREQIDLAALSAAGKVVLAIDRFALTANNITYATFGDEMSYWSFFPGSAGHGRIPVWGFADVVASGVPDLPVGDRVYGYFPMASHLVVEPGKVSPKRFVDAAAHRSKLPAVYNVYQRVAADPGYSAAREPAQMILQPLVITSFLIADFLADHAFFGAKQVAVSSASSKTSLGLGFCLQRLAQADLTTIGLTSSGNAAFVEQVAAFDRTVRYDDIGGLDASVPTVYVDMAGSADLLTRVHGRFKEQLVHSCRVGATHWEDRAKQMDLPGARPKFFFAPAQVQKRSVDWGPGGLEKRFAADWMALLGSVDRWLTVDQRHGLAAMETAYRDTLEGRVSPSTGLVLSLASA